MMSRFSRKDMLHPYFLDDLRESRIRGSLVPFIGAGMSLGAGLPDWHELTSRLCARINLGLPPPRMSTADTFLDAVQAYVNMRGRNDLVRFLRTELDTTDLLPTAGHISLARLELPLIFTSNFDDLLERAYRSIGRPARVLSRDIDVPLMARQPGTVDIVKLNGDLSIPETLVIAREDYEAYFTARPQLTSLLQTELARSDLLFIGWSHRDPHFGLVMGEVLARMGRLARPAYAITFETDEHRLRELTRRGVRVLTPSIKLTHSEYGEFIQSCLDALG
jgi:SIR2-like domain